jgi:Gluconate 2-dehydrogenase subunit 3
VRPPYANFYRAALGAVDRASQALNNGRPFVELIEAEQRNLVDNMRQNKIEGWQGPPGPFVYLVLRSDAVDVVYGTMDGYAALGIPYRPHIAPTKRW